MSRKGVALVAVGVLIGALVVVALVQAEQLQRQEREFRETQYAYEGEGDE